MKRLGTLYEKRVSGNTYKSRIDRWKENDPVGTGDEKICQQAGRQNDHFAPHEASKNDFF